MAFPIEKLEECLLQLMAPNTEIIKSAENALKKYLKQISCIEGFMYQMKTCKHAQVRQLSALLLRKKINAHWGKLDAGMQSEVKNALLSMALGEGERLVRGSIIQLIATLGKHQLPNNSWPELLAFVQQCSTSAVEVHREIAMQCFYCLSDTIGEEADFNEIKHIFARGLQDPQSVRVRTMAMKAACSLFTYLSDSEEIVQFQELVPYMMEVLKLCLMNGEEAEAIEFIDIFGDLAETSSPVLNPSMVPFVHLMLQSLLNEQLELSTRDSAANVLQNLITNKPKSIGKNNLTQDILNVLIELMTKDNSSSGGMFSGTCNFDEEEDDEEDLSPTRIAQRVLDVMALSMSPKYFDEPILSTASNCMQSQDSHARKAGTLALGVIAEGCADRLRPRIQDIIPFLYQAAQDTRFEHLREAACFALGQWAEHLQPEMAQQYETLLPIIFKLLDDDSTSVNGTSCYLLESLTEHMDDETLHPYLEALMTKLIYLVQNSAPKIQLMAISAIGSTACGAGDLFKQYLEACAHMLQPFLQLEDEKLYTLRGRALECLGFMAMAVGKETFLPYFESSMQFAIYALQKQDMELSDFGFSLCCNLANVFGQDFTPYLQYLVPLIGAAIALDDGMTIKVRGRNDANNAALKSFNDSDDEDDMDDGNPNSIISVRTAMLDMKTSAVSAIESVAQHTGAGFDPFIAPCVKMLSPMTSYYHDSVRASAISSLCQLVVVSEEARPPVTPRVKGDPYAVPLDSITQQLLVVVMEQVMLCLDDSDELVVEHALNGIVKISESLGAVGTVANLDGIMECALSILKEEHICQDGIEDDEDEEENEGGSLLELVCDALSALTKCYGDSLKPYLLQIIPGLRKYMNGVRISKDRATVFGSLAEICQEMGVSSAEYAADLVPVVLSGLTDEDYNVRQNCAFCLGIFAEVSGTALHAHYESLLRGLSPLFEDSHLGVKDNATAAVARMIIANKACIPMDTVFPVFLQHLPLEVDLSEQQTAFDCLIFLWKHQDPILLQHLHRVIELLVTIFDSDTDIIDDIVMKQYQTAMKWFAEQYPTEMQSVIASFSQEQQQKFQRAISF